jgi:hypothetical protein
MSDIEPTDDEITDDEAEDTEGNVYLPDPPDDGTDGPGRTVA